MHLLDANILIGAFRPDDPDHKRLKAWLDETLRDGVVVTFPPLVEVAFLRIVTHPRIFRSPSLLGEAIGFLQGGGDSPGAVRAGLEEVYALQRAVRVPVRFLGTGEALDDLAVFDAARYARRLVDAS